MQTLREKENPADHRREARDKFPSVIAVEVKDGDADDRRFPEGFYVTDCDLRSVDNLLYRCSREHQVD